VALVSVLAAVLLVATKLTVGVLTNSLGIMSEALHSGIDLIAAAMTLYAVRAAARPPDEEHMYGHEKVEALSSLGETILLFVTCIWILYEAVSRLFLGHAPEVEVGFVALGIMVLSMVVDFTRSRVLHRAAVKYKSQALEADAVHFSTDLISSAVVILGIIMTMLGFPSFDAIAALGVAFITAIIGYRLLKRSVGTLTDAAPRGISQTAEAEAMKVEGIRRVSKVRVRESGPTTYIELTVLIDKMIPLEQGHRIMDQVEDRIREAVPDADVIVHAEPVCRDDFNLEDRIRAEAADMPEVKDIHNIIIADNEQGRLVDFHVEMDGALSVREAHELATRLEDRVRSLDLCITSVASHVEPAGGPMCPAEESVFDKSSLLETIERIHGLFPEVVSCEHVRVYRTRGGLKVCMDCLFDPSLTVHKAHEIATRLEGHIRSNHSDVDSVTIHLEPAE